MMGNGLICCINPLLHSETIRPTFVVTARVHIRYTLRAWEGRLHGGVAMSDLSPVRRPEPAGARAAQLPGDPGGAVGGAGVHAPRRGARRRWGVGVVVLVTLGVLAWAWLLTYGVLPLFEMIDPPELRPWADRP